MQDIFKANAIITFHTSRILSLKRSVIFKVVFVLCGLILLSGCVRNHCVLKCISKPSVICYVVVPTQDKVNLPSNLYNMIMLFK